MNFEKGTLQSARSFPDIPRNTEKLLGEAFECPDPDKIREEGKQIAERLATSPKGAESSNECLKMYGRLEQSIRHVQMLIGWARELESKNERGKAKEWGIAAIAVLLESEKLAKEIAEKYHPVIEGTTQRKRRSISKG